MENWMKQPHELEKKYKKCHGVSYATTRRVRTLQRQALRVLGIAKHSETLEDFVVYECLHENKTSKVWIRPLKMFTEEVEVNGKKISRFKFVGN